MNIKTNFIVTCQNAFLSAGTKQVVEEVAVHRVGPVDDRSHLVVEDQHVVTHDVGMDHVAMLRADLHQSAEQANPLAEGRDCAGDGGQARPPSVASGRLAIVLDFEERFPPRREGRRPVRAPAPVPRRAGDVHISQGIQRSQQAREHSSVASLVEPVEGVTEGSRRDRVPTVRPFARASIDPSMALSLSDKIRSLPWLARNTGIPSIW